MNNGSTESKSGKRWIKKGLIAIGLVLLLLVVAMPWALGNTGLRDRLIATLIDSPEIQITSRKASVGYFSPFSIDGLEIDVDEGATQIEFERIEAGKSWVSMLMGRPELGTFTFVRPAFDVTVPDDIQKEPTGDESPPVAGTPKEPVLLPILTANIQDASVKVRKANDDQTAVDLEGVNVTFHLKRDELGSVLEIDPVTVFDRQELTPELCDKGLQLVAPLLGNEIGADGEFSFRLDKFVVPVGGTDADNDARRIEIEGAVQLHRAEIALKDTVVAKIVELAAKLLNEKLPEALTVANDSEVKFRLVDGQVHHEGFALMLPYRDSNVQLKSSGFVSLDGELDVELAMQLPMRHLGTSELAKLFSNDPIRVSITGDVEDPKIELVSDKDWSQRLAGLLDRKSSEGESEASDAAEATGEEKTDEVEVVAETAVEIAERVAEMLKKRREKNDSRDANEGDGDRENERLIPNLRDRRKGRRERRTRDN